MENAYPRSLLKIEQLARVFPVQYVVFDILYHRGKTVLGCPLMGKALLDECENDILAQIRFVEGNTTGLFEATGDAGLEGGVIKRKNSFTSREDSMSWQKVIH